MNDYQKGRLEYKITHPFSFGEMSRDEEIESLKFSLFILSGKRRGLKREFPFLLDTTKQMYF